MLRLSELAERGRHPDNAGRARPQARPREGRDVPALGRRVPPAARASPTWTWRRTAGSSLEKLTAAITDKTILVSHHARQQRDRHRAAARRRSASSAARSGVLFHCDAVQGVGKVPFDVDEMNVDLVSITAHKMYGPKGVGALYVRRKPRVRIAPIIDGGGHERGMRSGTLNVPAIVGLRQGGRARARRDGRGGARGSPRCASGCAAASSSQLDMLIVNGSLEHRLPGNLNVSFAFVEGEALMMAIKDVAVSLGLGLHLRLARALVRAARAAAWRRTWRTAPSASARPVQHRGRGRLRGPAWWSRRCSKLREMSPLYEMAKEGIDLKSIEWTAH